MPRYLPEHDPEFLADPYPHYDLIRGQGAAVWDGERSVWLVRRRAVQSPAAKAFTQTVVSFGESLRGRAPAVMPKGQEPPQTAFLKREKVLLVKGQT